MRSKFLLGLIAALVSFSMTLDADAGWKLFRRCRGGRCEVHHRHHKHHKDNSAIVSKTSSTPTEASTESRRMGVTRVGASPGTIEFILELAAKAQMSRNIRVVEDQQAAEAESTAANERQQAVDANNQEDVDIAALKEAVNNYTKESQEEPIPEP